MVATLTPENASCALKTAALVTLLTVGWVEVSRKRTRICGRVRGATLLDLAQLVLCCAASFVYFAKFYLEWPQNSPAILADGTAPSFAVADCVAATTVVIVCLTSLHRFFTAQYTSAYLLFVLALVFAAATADFCKLHERLNTGNQDAETTDVAAQGTLASAFSAGGFVPAAKERKNKE
ncbi:hypothetical protein HPB50_004176 [Hyalomma asiaticum]|uniref:Uncharacterized protein n=1 Tax=Hyalomma asiaticum TaxID=266040 RepID=A0ACB7RGR5_HYAAI|nr:hypothetical protein HPB50_004176 [Hyalomma asiaticum]